MQSHEFELSVGEAIRIENHIITLMDIEGGEVAIRIDDLPCELAEQGNSSDFPPAK